MYYLYLQCQNVNIEGSEHRLLCLMSRNLRPIEVHLLMKVMFAICNDGAVPLDGTTLLFKLFWLIISRGNTVEEHRMYGSLCRTRQQSPLETNHGLSYAFCYCPSLIYSERGVVDVINHLAMDNIH